MAAQFLADLKARPPAVILDTSPFNDHVPPINDVLRAEGDWQRWGPDDIYGTSPGTAELFDYINRNYVERGALRQFGSTIYIYGPRQASER